jgi:hypothetical protein
VDLFAFPLQKEGEDPENNYTGGLQTKMG